MSVSVSMPQLGESVTEGTVTRWLKREGERVEADEPLLEVSTDKVDTEIPSPVAGILRGITVAEDETVAVGAELAVIDETGAGAAAPAAGDGNDGQATAAPAAASPAEESPAESSADGHQGGGYEAGGQAPDLQPPAAGGYPYSAEGGFGGGGEEPAADYQQPAAYQPPVPPSYEQAPQASAPQETTAPPAAGGGPASDVWQRSEPASAPPPAPPAPRQQAPVQPSVQQPPVQQAPPPPPLAGAPASDPARAASPLGTADGPYVTPLVRKLASEHDVDLATVTGTGVGGRIRKQDVVDAARVRREAIAAAQQSVAAEGQAQPGQGQGPARPAIEPSHLRGTTERMSRARQLIARRMVESLQTSAQLTTVVEVDVTAIARLRDRAKADFEGREGVKLTFLPFFALAAVEALKVHPRLNASMEPEGNEVTYHDAEHLGIAVDTERGLMVPVIRNAGDLNVGGLARKIADLAARTRGGQVSPDDLAGGTFTLTNTGSRGALFDTPIINQPQVGILGTGTVVRRPVVVQDLALGEVIAVRSMVYLALSYDHRLVDGADAARFLGTVKTRLEEGAFEAELGL